MKDQKRNFLCRLMLLTIILIGVNCFGQSVVVQGESIDNIRIGESTETDVISNYGNDYKLVNHQDYSFEMIYKQRGLSFYYCAADPRKEIFVVEIEPPANVFTNKGIKLAVSTMGEVFRVYGEPEVTSEGYEYPGISFYLAEETEGEDVEDARFANIAKAAVPTAAGQDSAQSASNSETSEITPSGVKDTAVGDLRGVETAVAEGTSVSTFEVEPKQAGVGTVSAADTVSDTENGLLSPDEVEKKLVRRIELSERSGLRQCDTHDFKR